MANQLSTQLDGLLHAVNQKGCVIDTRLQVIYKFSLYWVWLHICCPFYWVFGGDAFSHVKAVNVADSLFKSWQSTGLAENHEGTQKVLKFIEILKSKARHNGNKKSFDAIVSNIFTLIYSTTINQAKNLILFWEINPKNPQRLFAQIELLKERNDPLYKKEFNDLASNILLKQAKVLLSKDRAILNDATIQNVFVRLFDLKKSYADSQKSKIYCFLSKKHSGLPIDIRVYFDCQKRIFQHVFLDLERSAYESKSLITFDLVSGRYYQRRVIFESEKNLLAKLHALTLKIIPKIIAITPVATKCNSENSYIVYQGRPLGTLTCFFRCGSTFTAVEKFSVIQQIIAATEILHTRGHANLNIRLDRFVYQRGKQGFYIVRFEDLNRLGKIEEMLSARVVGHPDLVALKAKLQAGETTEVKKQIISSITKKELQAIDVWDLGLILMCVLFNGYSQCYHDSVRWFYPQLIPFPELITAFIENRQVDLEKAQLAIDEIFAEICSTIEEKKDQAIQELNDSLSIKVNSVIENNISRTAQALNNKDLTLLGDKLHQDIEDLISNKKRDEHKILYETKYAKEIWELISRMMKLNMHERISAQELYIRNQEIVFEHDLAARKNSA